jgi:hypothetical protein
VKVLDFSIFILSELSNARLGEDMPVMAHDTGKYSCAVIGRRRRRRRRNGGTAT